jgi:hypothetical protein
VPTPEQAREALAPFKLEDWDRRRALAIGGLPGSLAKAARAVLDDNWWQVNRSDQADPAELLEKLKPGERAVVFDSLFPGLGDHLEAMWRLQASLPYQTGFARRAFRASNQPVLIRPARRLRLARLVGALRGYEPDPVWLARWAAYLGQGADDVIGTLLAAVITERGPAADEVYDVLVASADGEDEVGAMGRHVTRALLTADRPDGWEVVERLLIAAGRQEGLRQVVLESVDEAHPEAFRRVLRIVAERDLARFSATVRAFDVWLGIQLPAGSLRKVNDLLNQIEAFIADDATREAGFDSGDAETTYLALWASAYHDAVRTIDLARPLLGDGRPERRYVAAHLLGQTGINLATEALRASLDDDDLRVAARALDEFVPSWGQEPTPDAFDALERLVDRLPPKIDLEPIVWPWTARTLERTMAARAMVAHAKDQPVAALVRHLPTMAPEQRAEIAMRVGTEGTHDARLRPVVLSLVGDPAVRVRELALASLTKLKPREDEITQLEKLLTRKAGDLRRGVINLLVARPDGDALGSADRLMNAGSAEERLAGLEILRQLSEAGRVADEARQRAQAYRRGRHDLSEAERSQLDAILGAESDEPASLDDGLGLLNQDERTDPRPPVRGAVQVASRAATRCLEELDAIVARNAEAPVTFEAWDGSPHTELLGNMRYGFPEPFARGRPSRREGRPASPGAERLPLRETWEAWWQERSHDARDPDGQELARALAMLSHQPMPFQPGLGDASLLKRLLGGAEAPRLRYPFIVHKVLEWLIYLHPDAARPAFLLDAAEWQLVEVPLVDPKPERGPMGMIVYGGHFGPRSAHSPYRTYLDLARLHREFAPEAWDRDAHARLWGLLRWVDEPTSPPTGGGIGALVQRVVGRARATGAPRRQRPGLDDLAAAFHAGVATEADVIDHLIGARDSDGSPYAHFGGGQFAELGDLTRRRPRQAAADDERLREIAARCRARAIEVELRRGEAPSAASGPALAIRHAGGLDVLVPVLRALGRETFVRGWRYDGLARSVVFSHLIRSTVPDEVDTPERFAEEMQEAAIAGQRLLELGAFAPQWASHVEAALGWPALASAIWWMHAHTKDSAWTVEQEIRDEWAAEVTERTPLASADLLEGAVDVEWFRRVYAELGEERWSALDKAAKYLSSAGGHKRAQLYADAMRGAISEADLRKRLDKRQQDAVRALGLLPLPAGKDRDEVVLRRYEWFAEFRRSSRQFGQQRQASEKRAADIGLENLARTAGYKDPIRLSWAMEARGVADLADGPISIEADGVSVSLAIDARGDPELTIRRGDEALKALPAKVKKDSEVVALRRRHTELRRQVSRIRSSLELAMCRGDAFDGLELRDLIGHPLLGPLLSRVVLSGDGIVGWPGEAGAVLDAPDGRRQAVGTRDELRIAHPVDLLATGQWSAWQRDVFAREVVQPFKQVFRELYVPTSTELGEPASSRRYAGHQVQPRQALALLASRGWVNRPEEGVRRTFHDARVTAWLTFQEGFFSPAEIDGLTLEEVRFSPPGEWEAIPIDEVPPRIFSETMRDLDLVVSVAHVGGVDPEASASSIEMRAALVTETARVLELENVRIEEPRAFVDGSLGRYNVHLGSAMVHRQPGGALFIVAVPSQYRGRLFLPFADDDPKTAEVLSKVLMLARDSEIRDPTILEQIRA